MSDEKKLILRMLKEGKITEEEAITLLDSIKENNNQKKANFSQFGSFTQFENNLVEKISQAATKISKKSQEMINNFDFEDINIKFNSNMEPRTKAERVVSENIISDENPELEITNVNGKILITSWENEEIEAKADINYDDTLVSGDYGFVKITKEEGRVKIEPDYEKSSPRHFDMNIKVNVPQKIFRNIKVESRNGNIEIEKVQVENLEVLSTNSKVKLVGTTANNAKLQTTNARISIDEINGENLDVDTTNGKIELNNVSTKFVNLKSTNGTLLIANIKDTVENIKANTNSGNIMISLKDLYKPVKAKVKNHLKDMDTGNFSDSKFTNFVNEDSSMIAYSDGYDEGSEKLEIEASTFNGAVNIK